MAKQEQAASSIGDAAVKANTGRTWGQWFALLERAKARKLAHKEIVVLVSDRFTVPAWWRQMIAVEYERARGLRVRHETSVGISASISACRSVDLAPRTSSREKKCWTATVEKLKVILEK